MFFVFNVFVFKFTNLIQLFSIKFFVKMDKLKIFRITQFSTEWHNFFFNNF